MSASFIKKYPRAKVSPHPSLNGWVIDIILRANAKPSRVAATYASIPWAYKAAAMKVGRRPVTAQPDVLPKGFETFKKPATAAVDAGTCGDCNRPMRPAGTKASDHPGTTLRQRAGLCQSCNARNTRETA